MKLRRDADLQTAEDVTDDQDIVSKTFVADPMESVRLLWTINAGACEARFVAAR